MPPFITLEGIEGSGKTTLLRALADRIRPVVRELVVTREPGATAAGAAIREILLNPANRNLAPETELLLFAADRAQHVREVIRPALERGAIVLCDRYIHSTLAYQGWGRSLPLALLRSLNSVATGDTLPDLVLYLDLDPAQGLARASRRSTAHQPLDWNRFEEQELAFHRAVRQGFLELARQPENRFAVLAADRPPQEVADHAMAALEPVLAAHGVRAA